MGKREGVSVICYRFGGKPEVREEGVDPPSRGSSGATGEVEALRG
jgi:hypothetical protein